MTLHAGKVSVIKQESLEDLEAMSDSLER